MDPKTHTTTATAEPVTRPVIPTAGPVDLLARSELETSPSLLKRTSWGAIFAGAAVAAVLSIWFNLLGLAIGMAVYEPAAGAAGFGVGTVIWVLAVSIIALFAGGWVAGRFTGSPRTLDRALHGVVAWSVAVLFGLYILTLGATRVVGGAASMLGDVAGAAVPAVQSAIQQGDLPPEVQSELEGLVQEARNDPQLRQSVASVIAGDATQEERQRLSQELASRSDMSQAEAEQRIASWEQRAQEFRQTVAEKAEGATTAVSSVAFLGVVSMFLGLGAAALGGAAAAPTTGRKRSTNDRDRYDRTTTGKRATS